MKSGGNKRIVTTLLYMLVFMSLTARDNARWVNVMIGTGLSDAPTLWGNYGGTFPGATAPWGLIQLTPETSTRPEERGYYYHDDHILYFTCFDHNSGYPNGSSGTLKLIFNRGHVSSLGNEYKGREFEHRNEKALPGFYAVQFNDGDKAEMTAAPHSGIIRYITYSDSTTLYIVDHNSALRVRDNQTVFAKRKNAIMRFTVPFVSHCTYDDTLQLFFSGQDTISIELMCSEQNLKASIRNGNAELCNGDFESMRKANYQRWTKELACAEVESENSNHITQFYTALYHAMLMPRNIADVGEEPRYAGFSAWDTFRTLHPLLTLLKPKCQSAIIRSIYQDYLRNGMLPEGPMTGHHIIAILLDSYMKGATDLDISEIYDAASNSYKQYLINHGLESFEHEGYIDAQHTNSVSITTELAYDHWAMYMLAEQAGKHREARRWKKGANNYRNLWDTSTMFLLPRIGNDFLRHHGELGYQESTKWTATFFQPHNVNDMVNLHGGKNFFAQRLVEGFENGKIVFDNEPVLHYPTLFVWVDRPELALHYTRKIMERCYANAPGGIPGNDDFGSMSSWWAMAALGLNVTCPGSGEYILLPTIFNSATLYRDDGKIITISKSGKERSDGLPAIFIGGKEFQGWCIRHHRIIEDGCVHFDWDQETLPEYQEPYSMTNEATRTYIRRLLPRTNVVPSGKEIVLPMEIENKGETGATMLTVYDKGKQIAKKLVAIDRHSTCFDSIRFTLYEEGIHEISIEDKKMVYHVYCTDSLRPSLQCTDIDVPALIRLGSECMANVKIKNVSSRQYTGIENMIFNDSIVATLNINLLPGEEKMYICRISAYEKGLSMLKILDKERNIKVYENATEATILATNPGMGKALDESGFKNDGICHGPLQWGTRNVQTSINAFIEFPASQSLMQSTGEITILGWIKPLKAPEGYADFFTKGDYTVMKMQGRDDLVFFAGGWGRGTCMVKVPDNWYGRWHMVAGVGTADTLQLYVDGELVQQQSVKGKIQPTEVPWNIGRNAEMPFSRHSEMQIGSFRIYGAPLNENQIKDIYTNERNRYQ